MPFTIFKDEQFSPAEEDVIKYLEDHSENIDQLTIGELAKESHTSNATIIRLSKKAGCSGFADMKIKLVKERELQKFTTSDVDFSFPFTPASSLVEIDQAMTNLYDSALQKLHAHLDLQEILQLTRQLLTSKRTFIFGTGDSGLTVQSFINKINKLNVYPIFGSKHGEGEHNAKHVTEDDLAIFVTYGNVLEEYIEDVKAIHKRGGKIALITGNGRSILAKYADYLITVPPEEEREKKLATFYSQFAFEYVLNLIFSITWREQVIGNYHK